MSMTIRRNSRQALPIETPMPVRPTHSAPSTPEARATVQPFLSAWAAQDLPLHSASSAQDLSRTMFSGAAPDAALHTVQAECLEPSSVARVLRPLR